MEEKYEKHFFPDGCHICYRIDNLFRMFRYFILNIVQKK